MRVKRSSDPKDTQKHHPRTKIGFWLCERETQHTKKRHAFYEIGLFMHSQHVFLCKTKL